MIYPPIFQLCSQHQPLVDLISGDDVVRLFPFGEAERLYPNGNVPRPYVVWQQISGNAENYLGGAPDADDWLLQIDIYADTADVVREVAVAMRDAVEPHSHVMGWRGESRDIETQLYRFSFDAEWLTNRPAPPVPVDKSALSEAITAAGDLTEADYTPETWSVLSAAVQAGQLVFDDEDATQQEVDAAVVAINEAIAGLEPVPAECLIGLTGWSRDGSVEAAGENGTFISDQTFGAVDVTNASNHFVKAQNLSLGYSGIRWFELKNNPAGWSDGAVGTGRTGVYVVEQDKDPLAVAWSGAPSQDLGNQVFAWPVLKADGTIQYSFGVYDAAAGVAASTDVVPSLSDVVYLGIGGDGSLHARVNNAPFFLHRFAEGAISSGFTIYGDVRRISGSFSASTTIESTAGEFANAQHGADLCGNDAGGTAPPAITCTLDMQFRAELAGFGVSAADYDVQTGAFYVGTYNAAASSYGVATDFSSPVPVSSFGAGRVIGSIQPYTSNGLDLILGDFAQSKAVFLTRVSNGDVTVIVDALVAPKVTNVSGAKGSLVTLGVNSAGDVLCFVTPPGETVASPVSITSGDGYLAGANLTVVGIINDTNQTDLLSVQGRFITDASQLPVHPSGIRSWCDQPADV